MLCLFCPFKMFKPMRPSRSCPPEQEDERARRHTESICPGSQALRLSEQYPRQVNSSPKELKVYLSVPPADRWEGHGLLVRMSTGGRLELGVWRTVAVC